MVVLENLKLPLSRVRDRRLLAGTVSMEPVAIAVVGAVAILLNPIRFTCAHDRWKCRWEFCT